MAVVKSAQFDKLVRQDTDKAEWKQFLKEHPEITDDLINDTNKSTAGSPSHKLSLSHNSDSGEVLDTEDSEENEDAGDPCSSFSPPSLASLPPALLCSVLYWH